MERTNLRKSPGRTIETNQPNATASTTFFRPVSGPPTDTVPLIPTRTNLSSGTARQPMPDLSRPTPWQEVGRLNRQLDDLARDAALPPL